MGQVLLKIVKDSLKLWRLSCHPKVREGDVMIRVFQEQGNLNVKILQQEEA